MWPDLRLNIRLSLNLWGNAYCVYHNDGMNYQNQPKQCQFILRKQHKHKICNRKKCTELPLARQIYFAKAKMMRLHPVRATAQSGAAIIQDIPYQLVTSTPQVNPKVDTVDSDQKLWQCVTCRKMSDLFLK